MRSVKAKSDTSNNRGHLETYQNHSENVCATYRERTKSGNYRKQPYTLYTLESTDLEAYQNSAWEITLHVAQVVSTEYQQHCVP
jgi:hypothetical protein